MVVSPTRQNRVHASASRFFTPSVRLPSPCMRSPYTPTCIPQGGRWVRPPSPFLFYSCTYQHPGDRDRMVQLRAKTPLPPPPRAAPVQRLQRQPAPPCPLRLMLPPTYHVLFPRHVATHLRESLCLLVETASETRAWRPTHRDHHHGHDKTQCVTAPRGDFTTR